MILWYSSILNIVSTNQEVIYRSGLSIYFLYGLPNSYREMRRQRAGWQKLKYSEHF